VLFVERQHLLQPQAVRLPPVQNDLALAITRLQQRDEQMLAERMQGARRTGSAPPTRRGH